MEEALLLSDELRHLPRAVIPVPVETEAAEECDVFLSHFPIAAGRKIALFLSRIDPKKGIELLLEGFAAALTVDRSLLLVLAGAGSEDYVRTLKAKAEDLQVGRDVLWTGHLDGREKAAAFAAASLFILTSHSENFGVAPVEAMAAGVPVIISREVAISADVAATNGGLVVSRDRTELSDAIVSTLRDGAATAQRVENARRLVRDKYSSRAVGLQLLDLYQSVTRTGE